MIKTKGPPGIGLLAVLLSIVAAIVVAFVGFTAFSGITRSHKREADKQDSALAAKNLALWFKIRLDGTRSFQNISFHIPGSGSPGKQSTGPGVYVVGNEDAGGNPAPNQDGQDVLYFVVKTVGARETTFKKLYSPSEFAAEQPVHLKAADGSTEPLDAFEAQDFAAVSRPQRADLFRVVSIALLPDGADLVPDFRSSQSPTYLDPSGNPPDFWEKYRIGDLIQKAEIYRVGFSKETGDIVSKDLKSGASQIIATAASQFAIYYSVSSCTAKTSGTDFARDWAAFNADPSCYPNLKKVRIAFELKGSGPLSYEFPVN